MTIRYASSPIRSNVLRDRRELPHLEDRIERANGGGVWANDSKTLLYIEKHPTTLLGYRVKRHVLGTDPREDALAGTKKPVTL